MTPRFDAWQIILAQQEMLFLNLAIIVLSWLTIWLLHLRKNPLRQWLSWGIVYVTYYTTLVLCYLNYRPGA